MTREQVKAIFPEATDEQVDAFLNAHGSDVNKAKKSAADNNAEFERLKDIETQYETLKTSSLTEAEKLQKQLDAAMTAEKSYKKMTNRVTAEKLFVGAGLKDEDYAELLDSIVSEDADLTTKTATSFVGLLKTQRETTEKAIKEELMRNNPKPPAGGGGGAIDKKAFDAMSSKEQIEFKEKNPNWKEIVMKKE